MKSRISRVLSMLFVFAALPALAQYKTSKIIFKNPGPYDQASLETAAGLHTGMPLDNAGLQKSDQALMDTGLFDDAQGTVDGPVAAISVIFTLKPVPADQLFLVSFDNFIWWSPAELTAAVHQAVPLFRGAVPAAGNIPDAVEAALESLLKAKGISGAKVTHEWVMPSTAHPMRSMFFSIEAPSIKVHTVTLDGVSPELRPVEDKMIARLTGNSYSQNQIDTVLLSPYLDAGYLGAKLADMRRNPSPNGSAIDVAIAATVQPGAIYHVANVTFADSQLYSAAEFAKTATIHSGDVVSQKRLLDSLAPVDAAYHAQGYMDVAAKATPTVDEAAHTVSYSITVIPGAPYHLRSVTPRGFTPEQLAAFQRLWKMQPGDLYSTDYVKTFLKQNALGAFNGLNIFYTGAADPGSHLVDLVFVAHPAQAH